MKKILLRRNLIKYFGDTPNPRGFYLDTFLAFLIFLSIVIYIASTYPLPEKIDKMVVVINYFLLAIFSLEILLRFFITTPKNFFFNYLNWIDLLAILSFWFLEGNFQFLRIFRILRFFRFSKKYQGYFRKVVGKNQFEKLFIFKTFFIINLLLFVSSSLIYSIEKGVNPKINDIFDAFYFVVSTVTTVGFGDVTAITFMGKIITIITIFLGVMIIPYNLTLLLKEVMHPKEKILCKSCGLEEHDSDAVFCKHCGNKIFQKTSGSFE